MQSIHNTLLHTMVIKVHTPLFTYCHSVYKHFIYQVIVFTYTHCCILGCGLLSPIKQFSTYKYQIAIEPSSADVVDIVSILVWL